MAHSPSSRMNEWTVFPTNGKEPPGEYCVWLGEFEKPCIARNVIGLEEARLIAAAPDLLSACEALIKQWDAEQPLPGPSELWVEVDTIRAAIAKAKGESHD